MYAIKHKSTIMWFFFEIVKDNNLSILSIVGKDITVSLVYFKLYYSI